MPSDRRLIPARAGKTWHDSPCDCVAEAHPRACGENGRQERSKDEAFGSSPRVRGKRAYARVKLYDSRLIPARAGKTGTSPNTGPSAWAHPRACGENHALLVNDPNALGSSPRVRGKPRRVVKGDRRRRLIPARAGKTGPCRHLPEEQPTHPRACGENVQEVSLVAIPAGSSPRVRGKRPDLVSGEVGARLIPARAGKTRSGVAVRSSSSAHPRACGENWSTASRRSTASGSSPRVRGKRLQAAPHRSDAGLIPARAGKTCGGARSLFRRGAHPRACGENLWGSEVVVSPGGSSPRVRGKRPVLAPWVGPVWLIPARAGKT